MTTHRLTTLSGRCFHAATLLLCALVALPTAYADEACEPEWSDALRGYPGLSGIVHTAAVLNDGNGEALYAAGFIDIAYTIRANNIVKWDGSQWVALGTGIDYLANPHSFEINAMVMFDDGNGPNLYVAGRMDTAGDIPVNNIARWDGSSWSSVGPGLDDYVYALAVHDDGSGPALYAAGMFDHAGSKYVNKIAKWDGTTWSALSHSAGVGLNATIKTLVSSDFSGSSRLYAGGLFNPGGTEEYKVQSWDASEWEDVGSPLPMSIDVMTVSDHVDPPVLCVAGEVSETGFRARVRYWNGTSWELIGGETFAAYSAWELKSIDLGSGAELYFTGAYELLRWTGTEWDDLLHYPTRIYSLNVFDSGEGPELIVSGHDDGVAFYADGRLTPLTETGGLFRYPQSVAGYDYGSPIGTVIYAAADQSLVYEGAERVINIAFLQDGRWSSFPQTPKIDIDATCIFDDGSDSGPTLYVGGLQIREGDVDVNNIAQWDGQEWSPLGVGFLDGGRVRALIMHDDGSGPALYAAGSFRRTTTPEGDELKVNNIARWDGNEWSRLSHGIRSENNGTRVYALASMPTSDGPALFAAGRFDTAAGVPTPNIAEWRNGKWHALGSGFEGDAYAMAVFDDGSGQALYVGGVFTSVGGQSIQNIARWDGTNWSNVGAGLNDGVDALAVFDDGSGPALYASGWFTESAGNPLNYLARWDGTSWSAFDPTLDDRVTDLSVIDRGSGEPQTLILGGQFGIANGYVSNHITAIKGCPASLTTPCPGDLNDDNTVDLADFNVLGINFGTGPGATLAQGDLNDDGYVNLGDFNILGINFGNSCP